MYSVAESSQPQVLDLSIGQKGVVVQGQSLHNPGESERSAVVWTANFHYVAVKVTNNATGQAQCVVSGNGDYTINGINKACCRWARDVYRPSQTGFRSQHILLAAARYVHGNDMGCRWRAAHGQARNHNISREVKNHPKTGNGSRLTALP